jgi:hypothetical protein
MCSHLLHRENNALARRLALIRFACKPSRATPIRRALDRQRSSIQSRGSLWRATRLVESRELCLHGFFSAQNREHLRKHLRCPRVPRRHDAIVHPFAIASRLHDPSLAKVGKMTRNLGLALPQNFHEIAHAHFAPVHQVEQAQPRWVRQGCEKESQVIGLRGRFHNLDNIRIDTYVHLPIYSP